MVITEATTTIIYIILAICFVAPLSHMIYMVYNKNVAGGVEFENRAKPHLAIMLLTIILFSTSTIFCPKIYHVTACGEYTEEKVIFPNDKYSLGTHYYVNNQSTSKLYLEYVIFGEAKLKKEDKNIIIQANEIVKIKGYIKFLFEPIPQTLLVENTRSTKFLSLGCKPHTNPWMRNQPSQPPKQLFKTPPKIKVNIPKEYLKNSKVLDKDDSKKNKE